MNPTLRRWGGRTLLTAVARFFEYQRALNERRKATAGR